MAGQANSQSSRQSSGSPPKDIKGRCAEIPGQVEATSSDDDRERLQERFAKPVGAVPWSSFVRPARPR